MSKLDVIHLKPNSYTHILDQNASATVLKIGPLTFTKKEHEQILCSPQPFVVVAPRHYCIIDNPVQRTPDGTPQLDAAGQAIVRLGDQEVRMDCKPFPLYPGEVLSTPTPLPLQVLAPNTANRVKATKDFEDTLADGSVVKRIAGDEWLEEGPCTYYPHVLKEIVQTEKAKSVGPNEALKLRAVNTFVDRTGTERKVGSQWLWTTSGPYMPSVDEQVVEVVAANILSETKAIHVHCLLAFTDCFGQQRKPGDQWLVTHKDTETYIPTPNETVAKEVPLCVLNKKQYCILMDPHDPATKANQLSVRKLIKGPDRFFLHPGEKLEGGCAKDVYILTSDEALLLEADETFTDSTGVVREAGDRWMINGPTEYTPPVQVSVEERRSAIPMHEYEGVYVRDLKTGAVRSQMGPASYMLQPEEELWEKELTPEVEQLLSSGLEGSTRGTWAKKSDVKVKDRTRVVIYSVPHNSVCQIFDYKKKTARCICGPDMVSLNPNEEFTVISLSGGKPKVPGRIKCLALFLGPDFMTDNIKVETADHARLELQLSYCWKFDVDPKDTAQVQKVFSVPDFVGDSCKAIASRIRGCCAGETFDNFHKNSSSIIRHAVFGSHETWIACGRPLEVGNIVVTPEGNQENITKLDGLNITTSSGAVTDPSKLTTPEGSAIRVGKWPNSALCFPTNGLVLSNVDIQSVEPVDQKNQRQLNEVCPTRHPHHDPRARGCSEAKGH